MLSLVLAFTLFVTNQAASPAAPDNVTRSRAIVTALGNQEFASIEAQFTEAVRTAVPPGRLGTIWATILAQAGAFKGCAADPRVRSIADKQMVITACEFERAKLDVQIAFDSDGKISGFALRPPAMPYTPPSYANAAAYTEEDLSIGSPEWRLPGTLTVPVGAGPFPALILVHGSGPNDRDESIGANRPFKDLALGLASRGIAVLRYDKRSKVYGAKMAASSSITVKDEVVDDVGEAIKALQGRPRIDRARIYVLGHSLGGMLIPRILAAHSGIAGGIVLAGAAQHLEDAIVEQSRYLAMLDGTVSAAEQAQIDEATKAAAEIKALGPADVVSGKQVMHVPAAYWLDLKDYDPPAAAAALKTKLLVMQGERDYQVTMADLARWKAALASRPGVTIHSYGGLNHLFMRGTGPASPAEYETPSHVDELVVRDIASWILPANP